jgi:hypothetical protein
MTRSSKSPKRVVTGATLGRGATDAEARADPMAAAIETHQAPYVTPRTHAGVLPHFQSTVSKRGPARQLGDQVGPQAVDADAPAGPRVGATGSDLADKHEAYDKARRAGRGR